MARITLAVLATGGRAVLSRSRSGVGILSISCTKDSQTSRRPREVTRCLLSQANRASSEATSAAEEEEEDDDKVDEDKDDESECEGGADDGLAEEICVCSVPVPVWSSPFGCSCFH